MSLLHLLHGESRADCILFSERKRPLLRRVRLPVHARARARQQHARALSDALSDPAVPGLDGKPSIWFYIKLNVAALSMSHVELILILTPLKTFSFVHNVGGWWGALG